MKKGTRILLSLVCVLLLGVTGFSGYKIYTIQHGYNEAKRAYNAVSDKYTSFEGGGEEVEWLEEEEDSAAPKTEKKIRLRKSPLKVDFDRLLEETNPEIVAWIQCPDTVINYPVAQAADNSFYLNMNINREASFNGAIFLSAENFNDFSDRNSILHGHHMNDGSMFATLDKWQHEEYYKEHPVMYLNTVNGGNYCMQICAAFNTPAESDAYRFEFTGEEDIEDWIQWIDEQSAIHPKFTCTAKDKFLTLSTCAYTFENARSVLIGRLIPMA